MNKHMKRAMELRNETPMVNNCAQAILRTYADELKLSEEQAAGLGCNFGGGRKGGGVCGAVTSSLMVLGAMGVGEPDRIKEFRQRITDNHDGMINCADLLKANAARGGVRKEHCDAMICEAIGLIDEFAGQKEETEE